MTIKLSKMFFAALLFYYGWFQVLFFQIPNILPILGAGMIGFIVINALLTKSGLTRFITFELAVWILFAVTALVFGYFVAENRQFLFRESTNLMEYLMLIFGIIYISSSDGDIDFFVKIFIAFALICALTTIFAGVETEAGRLSMGPSDNPNGLGVNLSIGICCILYKLDFRKMLSSLMALGAVMVLTYGIILTGSRKSFIGIALLMVYWLLFVAMKDIRAIDFTSKVKGLLLIGTTGAAAYFTLYGFFTDSVLLARLTNLFESGSDTRTDMYDTAFKLFMENPLVGVGYNNFRAVSGFGTYSHSTYAEAIACTGAIGAFLYFLPYATMMVKYSGVVLSDKADIALKKQGRVLMGLFALLIFLGIGIIHFYELTSSIAFGMIFAFHFVNKSKFSEEVL